MNKEEGASMEAMSWLAEYVNSASMTFIGALISAIAGLLLSREHPRAKSLLIFLVCLGASITVMGGLWASYEEDQYNRALDGKTNKIIELSENLAAKSNEISELNKKLVEKSDELAATLHGGDSFAYILVNFMLHNRPKGNMATISLLHQGKYPLYEIEVHILDLQKFHQIITANSINKEELLAHAETKYSFRNDPYLQRLDPKRIINSLAVWRLPHNMDQQDYNVWISARNQGVLQRIRFRRINGEWRVAIQVINDDKVLIEEGADYLPRNEAGQVLWD